jgi:hypothetical protein
MKKARRLVSPSQLIADAVQPPGVKSARRVAYRAMNPLQGLEGLAGDALVKGRRRSKAHRPPSTRRQGVPTTNHPTGRDYMQVRMVNEATRQVKQRKVGFSWTTLFFGFFPALFRSDWKWALIQAVIAFFTLGFSHIVFAFIYNKIHMYDLIAEGYKPMDEFSYNVLVGKGFFIPDNLELRAWTPGGA